MPKIKIIRITNDGSMVVKPLGAILRAKDRGKPMGDSRSWEKPEGALDKLQSLFKKEKWRDQKEFEYYQNLVRKEPGDTFARLRLAEIYQKRGEKKKAIWEYFQIAETFSRKRLYPQAIAIYKRIQKQDPALFQLYPKFAEICRKMGFQEDASSQPSLGTNESTQKGVGPMVDPKSQDPTKPPEMALPGREKKGVLFDLGEQLGGSAPPECEAFDEIAKEKPYGFEEILKELKRTDVPTQAYPDFNYNMGVACREMGCIDEAIEQFKVAQEKGQKTFEVAHLLGLCYREKGWWNKARQSFEKALEVGGISQGKVLKVKNELARLDLEEKKEKEAKGLLSENPVGGQELRLLYRSQNQKKQEGTTPFA